MFSATIYYQDHKGAGCSRRFTDTQLMADFCSKLRRPAVIRNSKGEKVGEVMRFQNSDDRRVKWFWSFENDAT